MVTNLSYNKAPNNQHRKRPSGNTSIDPPTKSPKLPSNEQGIQASMDFSLPLSPPRSDLSSPLSLSSDDGDTANTVNPTFCRLLTRKYDGKVDPNLIRDANASKLSAHNMYGSHYWSVSDGVGPKFILPEALPYLYAAAHHKSVNAALGWGAFKQLPPAWNPLYSNCLSIV